MAVPHAHPHKTASKATKAAPKAKRSPIGKDGMTAFARKGYAGGSADAAKREKARKAAFKPSDSGFQVSASAIPKGFSRQGWARLSPSQRKMISGAMAANKK